MALETEGLCVGERLKIGRRKLRIEPASGKKSANGCLKTGSGVIGKTGAAPVGTRKMKGAEQALFAEVEVIERGDESVDVEIVTVMGIGIVQMLGTVVVIGVTRYAMQSLDERFAEAFALSRTDPAAVQRIAPEVLKFFERFEHLKALSKTP